MKDSELKKMANLTKAQRGIVETILKRHVQVSRDHGFTPTKLEIERVLLEAAGMVEAGILTAKDLVSSEFDVTQTTVYRYDVYTSPRND